MSSSEEKVVAASGDRWRIDLGAEGKLRAALLMGDTPFDEMLRRIGGRENPPRPQKKPGKRGGPFEGASRAVWTITPKDSEALDLFFNGRRGYRAAYSVTLCDGENASTEALTFFSQWLRDWTGARIDQSQVPLLGAGAKVWIPETERGESRSYFRPC
jgi:hypothetical protein